jgi:hypothetical protein
MYIYNVTITLEAEIEAQWLDWMQQEHIPQMINTGKFLGALMTKVITDQDLGGPTYSVQYRCTSKAILQSYYREDAENMRAQSAPFAGKFIAFRTELDVIQEFS